MNSFLHAVVLLIFLNAIAFCVIGLILRHLEFLESWANLLWQRQVRLRR